MNPVSVERNENVLTNILQKKCWKRLLFGNGEVCVMRHETCRNLKRREIRRT